MNMEKYLLLVQELSMVCLLPRRRAHKHKKESSI
jgi:hypothetical protein